MAKNLAARKNSKFKVISTSPSVNKTPRGPSIVDVPYDVQQDLSKAEGTSPNVFFNGDPAYLKTSHSTKVTGDKEGSKGGVKSGTVEAQSDPIEASSSVFINGKAVVRVGDKQYMQGKNTVGKVNGASAASAASITDDGQIVGLDTPPPLREPYATNKPTNNIAKSGELGSRTGSPVLVGSGKLLYTQRDITLIAPRTIELDRHYVSDGRLGMFGIGWSSSHEQRLIRSDASTLTLTFPDHRSFRFTFAENRFEDTDHLGASLTSLGGGKFELVYFHNGEREVYENSHLITRSDSNGNTQTLIRTANGSLERIVCGDASLSFGYHASGVVERISDHLGRTWKYRYLYDPSDKTHSHPKHLHQVIDPLGGIKRFEYIDDRLCNLYDEASYMLLSVTYEYLKEVLVPSGCNRVHTYTQEGETYTYRYEPHRCIKRSSKGDTTYYAIDGFGHISAITYPDGSTTKEIFENRTSTILDAGGNIHIREFDDRGRLIRYVPPHRDSQENIYTYEGDCPYPSSILEDGKLSLYTYDERFNRTSCTYANGKSESWSYSERGNILTHTDLLGATLCYEYNTMGKCTRIIDALGGITQFLYDDAMNLRALIDPNEKIERYEYDKCDRLIKIITFDQIPLRFKYDAARRLIGVEEREGVLTTYTHDTLGRLGALIHPDLRTRTYTYEGSLLLGVKLEDGTVCRFTYDRGGRLISHSIGSKELSFSYDSLGHLTNASDGYESIELVYDTRAQVILERQGERSVHHAYDRHGLKRFIGVEGMHFNLFRNASGELETISQGGRSYRFGYSATGELEKLCYPNRNEITHTFDPLGRLIEQDLSSGLRKHYGYDLSHRLVMRDESAIIYDEGYRVLQVSDQKFLYDGDGNRIDKESLIDPLTKRLLKEGDERFSYDQMGRLIEKRSPSFQNLYAYDEAGYLTTYTSIREDKTIRISFTYDPLGRRLTKHYKESSVIPKGDGNALSVYHHRYLYSGENIVAIYEYDTSRVLCTLLHQEGAIDSPLSLHIHPTLPVSVQEQERYDALSQEEKYLEDQSSIKRYYYHLDYQHSVVALSDEEGEVVLSYTYGAFGEVMERVHKDDEEVQTLRRLNPYRFTGREYDTPDLYYYRARYYDPTIGRFITPDPIGFLGGDTNLYRYVGNDPVNFVDWSGFVGTSTHGTQNPSQKALTKRVPKTAVKTPTASQGGGSASSTGNGCKVSGKEIKLEPKKYLYFVFYTDGNNPKMSQAIKKEAVQSVQNIKKYKNYDAGKDIIYLIKVADTSQTHKIIKEKTTEAKGRFKGAIVCTEVKLKQKKGRNSLTMNESFKKLGAKLTDGTVSDAVGVAFTRFFNEAVPDMWHNSPWYAKAPLVHAGAITGVGISHGGLLASNAFLRNPAEYSQGIIDVIEAYLPGPPPMSITGMNATFVFMAIEYEETVEGFKQSYEAVKKSVEEWFSK